MLLPTAGEKGWLRNPDERLHFYFSLHSFTFKLILNVLGLHMPHCSMNHAATALSRQEHVCAGRTHWDRNPSPLLIQPWQGLIAVASRPRKPAKRSWKKIWFLSLPQGSHPGTSPTGLNSNTAWQLPILLMLFPSAAAVITLNYPAKFFKITLFISHGKTTHHLCLQFSDAPYNLWWRPRL